MKHAMPTIERAQIDDLGVELTLRIDTPNGKSPGLEMMTGAPNQRGDRRDDHRNWSVAREMGLSQEEAPRGRVVAHGTSGIIAVAATLGGHLPANE